MDDTCHLTPDRGGGADGLESLESSSASQMHDCIFLIPRLTHLLKILGLVLKKNYKGKMQELIVRLHGFYKGQMQARL